MAESVSKKKAKAADGDGDKNGAPQTLEQLVLDKRSGKYQVVEKISFWAKELRKLEEHRHLTQTEILELAMTEVLGGKVCEDDLAKKMAEAKASEGPKGSEDSESSKK